jgi:hypothetical protein
MCWRAASSPRCPVRPLPRPRPSAASPWPS